MNISDLPTTEGSVDMAPASCTLIHLRPDGPRPDYSDAHFNLALLLTRLGRYDDALPVWERFLELDPLISEAMTAKRAIALCRMKINEEPARTG